jgi:hypothetical protein
MAISWALGLKSEPEIIYCWLGLIAGVIAIKAIATLQYPYNFFALAISPDVAAIQIAFAVLIPTQTRPLAGPTSWSSYRARRSSPRCCCRQH